MVKHLIILVAAAALIAGCATTPPAKDYTQFRKSDPHSLLVVPVINHSAEVEAADLFLTTLPVMLAERGYYVFPVNMTKGMMDDDGLSDAQLVHSSNTVNLASLFGADSVLYVEILDWKAQDAILSSNIQVGFLYTLKDGHTGDLIWQEQKSFVYSSQSSGNILADILAAAITTMINNTRSDYTPVAIQANQQALMMAGQGIPFGPHSPMYEKDEKAFPSTGTGNLSNATNVAVSYPIEKSAEDGSP